MPTDLLSRPISMRDWQTAMRRERNGPAPAAERHAADAWYAAISTLLGFRELGDNWDGLGARAPSAELIASAVGLACLLEESTLPPPTRVVPGLDRTVLLEWQEADGTYAEVEVVRPLYAEGMIVEPGKPAQHWTFRSEA
jgi:hypothetical protein